MFADVDHAVLAGPRLVKSWLPGHYTTDASGDLRRDGRRFRGGGSRLTESIEAYRRLLRGIEIRGAR